MFHFHTYGNCILFDKLIFSAIAISKPEEDLLKLENQKLRADVEELKSQLMLAEIKNGGGLAFIESNINNTACRLCY